jgi:hypothetical protein
MRVLRLCWLIILSKFHRPKKSDLTMLASRVYSMLGVLSRPCRRYSTSSMVAGTA